MSGHSALYVGRVRHHRFRPRRHALSYRVFWMLVDLDEVDELGLRLFSHNRFNLYSLHDRDYGDRSGRPLRPQVEAMLGAAGITAQGVAVRLLTMPRILGYAFNPLSTYFCYRADGELCATIYEVHNTFGEVHSYVVPAAPGRTLRQETEKVFHVSPFMDRDMRYGFHLVPPGEAVSVAIEASDRDGRLLTATMNGQRRLLRDGILLRLLASHPLVTLKVTAGIHWHALRLLAKRVSIRPHPAPPERPFSLGRPIPSAPPAGASRP